MWRSDHLPSVDSTQLEALRRLDRPGDQTMGQPFVLWTTQQTQGQGRHGRVWVHCGQALAATFAWPALFRPRMDQAESAWPIRISLAVVEAIAHYAALVGCGPSLGVKWPNDIMVENAKLGGVLVHRHRVADVDWLVAGVGLNLKWEVEQPVDRPVADLVAAGLKDLDAHALMQTLQDYLAQEIFSEPQLPMRLSLPDRFWTHDVYAGLPVAVHDATTGNLLDQGLDRGINVQGELLLETTQTIRTLRAGEISLRLAKPAIHSTE